MITSCCQFSRSDLVLWKMSNLTTLALACSRTVWNQQLSTRSTGSKKSTFRGDGMKKIYCWKQLWVYLGVWVHNVCVCVCPHCTHCREREGLTFERVRWISSSVSTRCLNPWKRHGRDSSAQQSPSLSSTSSSSSPLLSSSRSSPVSFSHADAPRPTLHTKYLLLGSYAIAVVGHTRRNAPLSSVYLEIAIQFNLV